MGLIQFALPSLLLILLIQFKLPSKWKTVLFRVPVWISSTILSLFLGHLAPGVMGFYAAALCDIVLFPVMLFQKRMHERKVKEAAPQKQVLRSKALALAS